MIDLRSDTVTRPSRAMREAAAEAAVGDDVYREDPTVTELEARAAERLGMPAALYCPSGTMANQVAVRTHTDRGEEAIVERESHVYRWELGGLAQHSALQVRPVDAGPRGVITPEQVAANHVDADAHRAGTGILCLEDTHNARGGAAIAPAAIDAAAEAAADRGVPVHLDGARLGNAAVAHDVDMAAFTGRVDSVMLSLSKGLGAPVGSVLAGEAAFIEAARRTRKLFGGGMRQAGIIAAPGLLALDTVDRLGDDHANAVRLAAGLDALDGLAAPEPETNIVVLDVAGTGRPAPAVVEAMADAGVAANALDAERIRLVTHLDVDAADVDAAVEVIGATIA